jgi:hypothetical protein
VVFQLLVITSPLLFAQTPTELDAIHFSGHIHTRLPNDPMTNLILSDDGIAQFNLNTGFADGVNWLGQLDSSDVDGFHFGDPGCVNDRLFSVETHADIMGTVMTPADVFTDFGVKIIDAAAAGVADGVNVDAVSRDPVSCDIVISIDVIAELDGTVFRPDDLIRWNAATGFSLFQAGNIGGNVDAVHVLPDGRALLSLDADTDLGSMFAQDDDVIEQIPGGPGAFFELAFSPRSFDDSWQAADLDAVWALPAPLFGDFRWTEVEVEVFENAGNVTLTIERINGAENGVTVNFTTVDDTAISGNDFGGTSGGVGFAENELSETVTIPIFDNGTVQGTRRFFVDLTATSAGDLIEPTRVRVLIRDDEDFVFADGFEH